MSKSSVYFSGLNELRAIAAFAVIFHHIELYKYREGLYSLYSVKGFYGFIDQLGHNGVLLFFTLSGFLVTFLLLKEKAQPDGIRVFPFYVRRMLRIWPLYFITLFIGFFLVPFIYWHFPDFFSNQHFYNNLIKRLQFGLNFYLYLFFMSNIALGTFGGVPGASQNWSVSMEEQFYIVWPWIIKFSGRFLIVVLIAIIAFANFCEFAFLNYGNWVPNPFLKNFLYEFDFDFMAFGALTALGYYNFQDRLVRLVKNPYALIGIGLLLIYPLAFEGIRILKAVAFCGVILSAIVWKISIKPLDWSGKISYGLYMYHPFVMYISFSLFSHLGLPRYFLNPYLYLVIPGLSIGVSLLSYKYIELAFLRKKEKFSSVKSGNIEV